ncbi:hypothetical protein CHS0354_025961 [Potamilus streckersoni]|uniref:RING-type domain-containing protein n=1 Tax=Potamilus streckersoni TaxID=2493646 RepID=A0AAE0T4Z9_9BIVA|nr:hypothetical protein CHS0354_025961 [Potamilus streckersoni]
MAERIIVSNCTNLLDSPDSKTSDLVCKLRPHFGGQFICFKWNGESSLDVVILRHVGIIDKIKDCFHRVSSDHIWRLNAQMSSSNEISVSFILLCQMNKLFLCRYPKIEPVIKRIYNYLAEEGFRISFMEYNSEDSSFKSKRNNKNYSFSAKLHRQIRRYESLSSTNSVITSDKLVKKTNSGKRQILSKYRIKKPTKKLKMVTPRCKEDRHVYNVYPLHGANQHTNPAYPLYSDGNSSTRTSLQDTIRNMGQCPSQITDQIDVRHGVQSLSIDDERHLDHTPNSSSGSLPTPMECEDSPCTTISGQPLCHDGASSIEPEADISQETSKSEICINGRSLDQTLQFEFTGINLYNATTSAIDSGPYGPQAIARQSTSINDLLRILGRVRSPEYADFKDRLDTFSRWPSDIVQTPAQVAEAGFFYTGSHDIVRCFACDGGLKNWDPDDDPWVEHARWFPQCAYVLHVKGEEFINLAQMTTEESDEEYEYAAHAGATLGGGENSSMNTNSVSNEMSIPSVLETEGAKLVLRMGYSERDVALAINDIFKEGKDVFTGQDIADIILEKEMRKELVCSKVSADYSTSVENITTAEQAFRENKHLKEMLQCIECKTKERNILFLPCTHHVVCESCSRDLHICTYCYRKINEKIRTYMS